MTLPLKFQIIKVVLQFVFNSSSADALIKDLIDKSKCDSLFCVWIHHSTDFMLTEEIKAFHIFSVDRLFLCVSFKEQ